MNAEASPFRLRAISAWLTSQPAQACPPEQYHDLHIDEIDPVAWKDRSHWVEGAVIALQLATVAAADLNLPHTVALAFSLGEVPAASPLDPTHLINIEDHIDWSPPSLYCFNVGSEPWLIAYDPTEYTVLVDTLPPSQVCGLSLCCQQAMLLQFKSPASDAFSVTLFVLGLRR